LIFEIHQQKVSKMFKKYAAAVAFMALSGTAESHPVAFDQCLEYVSEKTQRFTEFFISESKNLFDVWKEGDVSAAHFVLGMSCAYGTAVVLKQVKSKISSFLAHNSVKTKKSECNLSVSIPMIPQKKSSKQETILNAIFRAIDCGYLESIPNSLKKMRLVIDQHGGFILEINKESNDLPFSNVYLKTETVDHPVVSKNPMIAMSNLGSRMGA